MLAQYWRRNDPPELRQKTALRRKRRIYSTSFSPILQEKKQFLKKSDGGTGKCRSAAGQKRKKRIS